MNRAMLQNRPLTQFALLAAAFAGGILVERSGRLFTPYYYTPSGLEKTFAPFWEAWHDVDKHFVDRPKVDSQLMTRGAIHGMLASLGDVGHTAYLTPENLKQLKNSLEGSFEGIGARLHIDERGPSIFNTMPHSPARAAGIKSGDIILQVDGKSVSSLTINAIASMVMGPAGTKVHLQILRPGQLKPLEFDIERAKLDVPDVSWHLLPGGPIAHIAITSFGDRADSQMKTALEETGRQGARALLLDLRGNSGGLKDQAVAVTSEFLTGGNVFIEQDAEGHQKSFPVHGGGIATSIPLCVLIDQGSASSAEIFAGAIQDHARGKLVGVKTFGTGTVLQRFDLSDGSALLLAVLQWLTPDGRQIWHHGITPDIEVALPPNAVPLVPEMEVDLTAAALAKNKDTQLLKGMEVLKKELEKGTPANASQSEKK
jgi:carboxyl-terminal processing protease